MRENIQVCHLHCGIDEGIIALLDQPLEDAIEDCPGNATNSVCGLLTAKGNKCKTVNTLLLLKISPGLTLGHPLSADLDPGLAESLDHLESVNLEDTSCLAREAKQ